MPPRASLPNDTKGEDITVQTVTSEASSTLGTLTSVQTTDMFPPKESNLSFASQPAMLQLLKDIKVMHIVIQRLATIGLVTPQHIVNAFGLQEARIAQTFLQMGCNVMVDRSTEVSCHILVMFRHSQTIGTGVLCGPSVQWDALEKDLSFNEELDHWRTTELDFLSDFLSCHDKHNSARQLLK